jgi:hypothetical protein
MMKVFLVFCVGAMLLGRHGAALVPPTPSHWIVTARTPVALKSMHWNSFSQSMVSTKSLVRKLSIGDLDFYVLNAQSKSLVNQIQGVEGIQSVGRTVPTRLYKERPRSPKSKPNAILARKRLVYNYGQARITLRQVANVPSTYLLPEHAGRGVGTS